MPAEASSKVIEWNSVGIAILNYATRFGLMNRGTPRILRTSRPALPQVWADTLGVQP